MGQYYHAYTKTKDGIIRVFNRNMSIEGRPLVRLCDHSWWRNPFMMAFSNFLYENGPMQVAWVGDCADEFEGFAAAWRSDCEPPMREVDFTLDDKFLVNETAREFLDCSTYRERSETLDKETVYPHLLLSAMHPLSLLTAIGNGRGGGDYYGPDQDYIGRWANDTIAIRDEAPKDYTEIFPVFVN